MTSSESDASAMARQFGASISVPTPPQLGLHLVAGDPSNLEAAVTAVGGRVVVRLPDTQRLIALLTMDAQRVLQQRPGIDLVGSINIDPTRFARFVALAGLDATYASRERAQLNEQSKHLQLPPAVAAALVNDFVTRLSDGLPDLAVRDGELNLKVAFTGAGETGGFVLPTAEGGAELRDSLQEVRLRFGRTVEGE